MADASVRPARAADVSEIARIQLDTWRAAYSALLPPTALDDVTPELAGAQWSAAVNEAPSPRHRVLVAQERDSVVGFLAAEPDPDDPGTTMIATMLVEPRWGRRGHGSRLLAAAVDLAREEGTSRLTAWVFERDQASIGFYESAGWSRDGWTRTLDAADTPVREVRLHTSLLEEAA
ncbi:MAG: GNAT family N-acetyltransferase [Geodermatophilaceae bacterium]|nr:GNAT family N-acetyltransferase [Geodermatophilaceae bacterium]